jgi:hypothetical protein
LFGENAFTRTNLDNQFVVDPGVSYYTLGQLPAVQKMLPESLASVRHYRLKGE